MKTTKYLHSCLLVEEQGKTIIIDPGNYTYQEKALDISKLKKLDYILITHEHEDHMYIPFIKELIHRFPNARVISNSSIKSIFQKEDIEILIQGDGIVEVIDAPHEKPLTKVAPSNVLFRIFNKLTHPGDSLEYNKTTKILALPLTTSGSGIVRCLDHAVSLKPQFVIPIHDYLLKDRFRKWYYERAKEYLDEYRVKFISLELGETIEL